MELLCRGQPARRGSESDVTSSFRPPASSTAPPSRPRHIPHAVNQRCEKAYHSGHEHTTGSMAPSQGRCAYNGSEA